MAGKLDLGQCKFTLTPDERCKTIASYNGQYCYRHQIIVETLGSEELAREYEAEELQMRSRAAAAQAKKIRKAGV